MNFYFYWSSISLLIWVNSSYTALSSFSFSKDGRTSSSSIFVVSYILNSFFFINSSDYCFLDWYWLTPDASSISPRTSGGFMFMTLVTLPYIIKKWGLFTLSLTDMNSSLTFSWVSILPLMWHLTLLFSIVRVTEILSKLLYPGGENYLSLLSNTSPTEALETEELPPL